MAVSLPEVSQVPRPGEWTCRKHQSDSQVYSYKEWQDQTRSKTFIWSSRYSGVKLSRCEVIGKLQSASTTQALPLAASNKCQVNCAGERVGEGRVE